MAHVRQLLTPRRYARPDSGQNFGTSPNVGPAQQVQSYANDAGHGSRSFDQPQTLRSALLGTVAAGALFFGYGRRAYADCTGPAPTLTCTGDIAGTVPPGVVNSGINVPDAPGTVYTTLHVLNVTGDLITPASNVDGINFTSASNHDITIYSDANILTSGTGSGIRANPNGYTGNILIDSTGDVTSVGGYGIVARDVSGNVTITSDGSVTANSSGIYVYATGAIGVDSTGDVSSTAGYGIAARSTGSGDVVIHSAGAISASTGILAEVSDGSFTITSTGDITSSGNAIYARGSDGGTITLYSGNVHGGIAGVRTGGNVTLNNSASLSGGTYAVFAFGTPTINNDGTIAGNMYAGGPAAVTFNNLAGGIFNSGDDVDLGTGTLTNAGTLSPGGTGTVRTTALTGSLVQTGTGTFSVDVGGATADRVTISGTADLAGSVVPNVLSDLTANSFTILTAAGGVTNSGLTVIDTPVIDFGLDIQANTVNLVVNGVDFAISGLNQNQTAVGNNLTAIFNAGGGTLGSLLAALGALPSSSEFAAALNQLLPEIYSDAQIAALYSSLGFANNLLSCKVNGTSTASIIEEGQCLWAGANATFLDQGTTFSNLGFTDTTGSFAAGVQFALDPDWRLGFGAGYQQSRLETATNATSESDAAQAGVALKYNSGPLLLAGVVSGGRGWYDTTRPVAFTGFSGTAAGDTTIDVLNGGLRLAYVFGSPQLYFKPTLDAAVTRLDLGGFSETGGGAANLNVLSNKQTVYTIAPSVEMGTEWWLANGTLIRPFLRAGATFYEGSDIALSASFLGAPVGISPFTIHTDMDDVMGVVGAGLDMITAEDTALRLSYDGQLGETTQIHALGVKGSVSF